MNEEENNSLNNLNNTNLEPAGTPTPVVGPTPSENPTPVIESSAEPTPTLGDKPMNDAPKKNNSWIIIVAVLLVLLVGGGILLTQSGIFDKKEEEEKTEEKKEKETEKKETKEEDFSKYSGVYKNNNNTLKIYYDGTYLNYILNGDADSGFFVRYDDTWKEMFSDDITLELNEDSIVFTDKENANVGGTYKKEKDYTLDEFFKDSHGDLEHFDSKYNGYYKKDKAEMITYQLDDESVRVFVRTEDSTFDVPFDIKEDGSLYDEFLGDEYVITFDDKGNATWKTLNEDGDKDNDGVYTKEGKATYEIVVSLEK